MLPRWLCQRTCVIVWVTSDLSRMILNPNTTVGKQQVVRLDSFLFCFVFCHNLKESLNSSEDKSPWTVMFKCFHLLVNTFITWRKRDETQRKWWSRDENYNQIYNATLYMQMQLRWLNINNKTQSEVWHKERDRWPDSRGSVFPPVSPVSLNPQTVYYHMDAVIMCSDWDTDPPNILESDKVAFFALHYIITRSSSVNWTLSDSLAGTEADFWGKVHRSLGLKGWFIFITNTRWVHVCRWQTLFLGQKCEEESGGLTGGRTNNNE